MVLWMSFGSGLPPDELDVLFGRGWFLDSLTVDLFAVADLS
jgi:hypothetical protein